MIRKLFHKDCFLPEGIQTIVTKYQKNFNGYYLSKHLKTHLEESTDRSHAYLESMLIECLDTIKDNPQEAFEIEATKDFDTFNRKGWVVTKYCIRIPYDSKQDIVVSIRPQLDKNTKKFNWNNNLIVTAWMNAHSDNHYTLDETKYCSEKEWKLINNLEEE